MTMPIVDQFKAVNIEHENGQPLRIAGVAKTNECAAIQRLILQTQRR